MGMWLALSVLCSFVAVLDAELLGSHKVRTGLAAIAAGYLSYKDGKAILKEGSHFADFHGQRYYWGDDYYQQYGGGEGGQKCSYRLGRRDGTLGGMFYPNLQPIRNLIFDCSDGLQCCELECCDGIEEPPRRILGSKKVRTGLAAAAAGYLTYKAGKAILKEGSHFGEFNDLRYYWGDDYYRQYGGDGSGQTCSYRLGRRDGTLGTMFFPNFQPVQNLVFNCPEFLS